MEREVIGLVTIGALFVLVLLGCPIGLAMIVTGGVAFYTLTGLTPALGMLQTSVFETASNYSFTLVPLFLLMGNFISESGMARSLFRGSERLTGRWNGGLAAAGVTASALFSTVSGSSLATASTMTRVAYPEMVARGYDPRLATGSLAAGGTLGIMIPPSIALLLYALITEQSVGEMFLAGILPGVLAYVLYMATVAVVARRWRGTAVPDIAEELSIGQAIRLFAPAVGLFALVMGGLYGGAFTPTEAGGVGAALAFLYALATGVPAHRMVAALRNTVSVTATIFMILIGAEVFGFVLSISQIPMAITDFVRTQDLAHWQVLAIILVFYIVMGCFMESLAMILLTVPIFFPIVMDAGFDPVWFGIIAVVTVELGLITPPMGMNLFMVKSVAETIPLRTVMVGVLPFVVSDLVRLAILIAFPAITLFLPGRM
ncbi:C4-dicarboxylate ABC transporter permease [Acuticoccus sediminis]|uniref:TRAP transporter large permease protein n=1 Tax=Acuticoccus sediminis TaxID=2184697 RepID=A0A8B2NEQ4_9HYPH|nr:TRAP transporter large permease [Acuticoccus sediminis]RAH97268.1 C4-dicarboxylate ABC transporter permease [Acuticoccus sediminis]